MKTKDFMIIGGLFLVALLVLLVLALSPKGNANRRVNIYVNGEYKTSGMLGQTENILITGDNGEENEIAFTFDGVYMLRSTCHNQQCIKQGAVTVDNYSTRALGTQIICLPNRVVVEMALDEAERGADLPDV